MKEAAEHDLVSDMKRDITRFETVLSIFTQTGVTSDAYLREIPTAINELSCGPNP